MNQDNNSNLFEAPHPSHLYNNHSKDRLSLLPNIPDFLKPSIQCIKLYIDMNQQQSREVLLALIQLKEMLAP